MDGIAHLTSAIAAHLRDWEPSPPFVELAIFETSDPQRIAQKLNVFCEEVLGAHVVRGLFYQSSIGSVTGVALSDARSVVIKAHQPERSREHLTEIARVQNHLAEFDLFAPRLIAGPVPLARGLAMVEPFTNIGTTADAHRPEIRRALARSLRSIVTTCESLVSSTSLGPTLFSFANGSLWPTPHSKLFDFAATGHGAEWIDEIAMRARTKMRPTGVRVIGHSDWRQEHVRFIGDAPVAGFDWDSLCCDYEPALVGSVANGFCADWSLDDRHQAPTRKEALGFISDYEDARGEGFSADERRLVHACLVYACAYTARCGHAAGSDHRRTRGTFQHLLWTEVANLLDT
jgi:hypothetical protein